MSTFESHSTCLLPQLFVSNSLHFFHVVKRHWDREYSVEYIMVKGENIGNQHVLLFPTMFSISSQINIIIQATFVQYSSQEFTENFTFWKVTEDLKDPCCI